MFEVKQAEGDRARWVNLDRTQNYLAAIGVERKPPVGSSRINKIADIATSIRRVLYIDIEDTYFIQLWSHCREKSAANTKGAYAPS
jgi:hypothetical protein